MSSDLAASHVKSSPAPNYPPLAQTARIQGNVILHIAIDRDGNVSPLWVVRGHPMLVPAAVSGVRNWKYSPFTSNGQPVPAVTVTVVRFGNSSHHDAEENAEVAFQDTFWAAIDRAQAALNASDLAAAEKGLSDAQAFLAAGGAPPAHARPRWQWAMSMGDLNWRQNKFTDAEQRYTEALILQKDNKDGPEAAISLLALGGLYFESNKSEQAKDRLAKAVSIFQKNYKAAAKIRSAQEVYVRGIVDASWMLSKLAFNEQNQDEAARRCRNVLEYKNSLSVGDPKVKECEQILATPK